MDVGNRPGADLRRAGTADRFRLICVTQSGSSERTETRIVRAPWLKLGYEAFDGVVGALETVPFNQVLVDGGGVAAQAQLGVDESAVWLALGCGHRHRHRQTSRRPGWSSLPWRVGGHPGAVCPVGGKALLIRANGVARDTGDAFDLTLGGAALEQRPDGGL